MSENNTTLEATRKQRQDQVRQQYIACSFLAKRFAEMCDQLATTVHIDQSLGILDQMGESSAEWMEILGDILINADACNDETDWLDPIFEASQKMFLGDNKDDITDELAEAYEEAIDGLTNPESENVAFRLRTITGKENS